MASIGGGYVWPRLRVWGDGEGIGLVSYADPPGVVGPVRYVTDVSTYISGADFDSSVDRFLGVAVDEAIGFGSDRHALKVQFDALRTERDDPELSFWRRLEAQAGFDPDAAPDVLMNALAEFARQFGERGVEEAVLACPGIDAANELARDVEAASSIGINCDFSNSIKAVGGPMRTGQIAPWRVAEDAGKRLRLAYGARPGPLQNSELLEFLNVDKHALDVEQHAANSLRYGLRLKTQPGERDHVVLRSRWASSRRFELARALGDAVWTGGDALGPIARSKTARQQFQRAFAQNLLCPFDDLLAYTGTDPSAEDVQAAAKHFDVSERVVQTALVNRHVIDRERFEELIDEAA